MPTVASRTAATTSPVNGVPKNSVNAGSSTASQITSSSEAAIALPAKIATGDAGVISIASSEACSRSAAKVRPKATSPANTRASQRMPGAIAGALRASIWKPKFPISSASTMNCASAGTISRVRHSDLMSLRATARATRNGFI